MKITIVSDLHGQAPVLKGGDLLIIAGDMTARNKLDEWAMFFEWLKKQDYRKKILIAGNHDNFFMTGFPKSQEEADHLKEVQSFLIEQVEMETPNFEYLCDSGCEFEGFKIWGSPWTKTFPNMNEHCMAFTENSEAELWHHWNIIPKDTDILITHSPPFGIFDKTYNKSRAGSKTLTNVIHTRLTSLKLHCFGHIHEGYGKAKIKHTGTENEYWVVNASHMNQHYEPINLPIEIEL